MIMNEAKSKFLLLLPYGVFSVFQLIASLSLDVGVVLFYYYNAIAIANAWLIILISGSFFSILTLSFLFYRSKIF